MARPATLEPLRKIVRETLLSYLKGKKRNYVLTQTKIYKRLLETYPVTKWPGGIAPDEGTLRRVFSQEFNALKEEYPDQIRERFNTNEIVAKGVKRQICPGKTDQEQRILELEKRVRYLEGCINEFQVFLETGKLLSSAEPLPATAVITE